MTRARGAVALPAFTTITIAALLASTGYLLLNRPVQIEERVKEVAVEKPVEVVKYVDKTSGEAITKAEAEELLAAIEAKTAEKKQVLDGAGAPIAEEFETRVAEEDGGIKVLRDWSQRGYDDVGYGFKIIDVYGTPCILYDRMATYDEYSKGNPTMDCLENSS